MEVMPPFHNPQEGGPTPSAAPFATSSSSSSEAEGRRRPGCVFDLFLDLPHPSASSTSSSSSASRIIDPPVTVSPLLAREMYAAENVARLSRLAFPEHDDEHERAPVVVVGPDGGVVGGVGVGGLDPGRHHHPPHHAHHHRQQHPRSTAASVLTSRGLSIGAHLTKHDVYNVDFAVHHHTFSLLLSDGATRVHGHVRRYLPSHADSRHRMDVGRRSPRAMVLLTRAMGGERFYSSVLKTIESITLESRVNKSGCFAKKKDPARSFLHALFNQHATLITQYAELRRHGLSLNFTQAPKINGIPTQPARSACEIAKAIMEENEDLFRITLDGVEFGAKGGRKKGSNIRIEGDILRFHLPFTLQPGFECLPPGSIPEDIASPIIPLLRYIGPSHFIRVLSALLCERRIIFISRSITRLSMGVRAASSALAQGLLMWRHVLIPVVPPSMMRFLSVKAPYLVGVLHQHASKLGKMGGLTDVMCVNLDKNELKTLNMANPRITVPDMLKKVGKKSDSGPNAAECMARDLDEIVKADQVMWQHEVVEGKEKNKEPGVKLLDTSESLSADRAHPAKQSFLERMKHPLRNNNLSHSTRITSLEEKREYASSVDAAVAFGKMIRSTFQGGGEDEESGVVTEQDDETQQLSAPKYTAPTHEDDVGGVDPSTAAENGGGEEDVRAALTCFFIHTYGDMGMYLSETHETFWLDRRKFLLRKKQLGEKENTPTFLVLQKFSASDMFAIHVKGRIDDMSMTARDRSNIMPHHIPLFDVCSKYLSVHRLEFSLINVRRIVAKTVLACTRHLAVEKHKATRKQALALTDDAPYEGCATEATSELVDSCHECNTNLSVVMSVIWHRLNQTKTNMHILLALHLLKTLMSEGPLTAITEALDGAGKIYELKSFSDSKNADHNREVRQAADHVYGLLVDLSSLFSRRRRVAYSKALQLAEASKYQGMTWSDYLVRRLPFTTEAKKLHTLFRPEGVSGRVFYDVDANDAPSVAASNTPSIMALSRLGDNRLDSRMEVPIGFYDGDEEDRLFGPAGDGDLRESIEDSYAPPPQESVPRRSFNSHNDDAEYQALIQPSLGSEPRRSNVELKDDDGDERQAFITRDAGHDVSADNLFTEQDGASKAAGYENGTSMLESFNYAVSSRGGSHFGSERLGSTLPSVWNVKTADPSISGITEGVRRFSFKGNSARENEEKEEAVETLNAGLEVSTSSRGLEVSTSSRHPFLT